jgi:hypothetical protein
LTSGRLLSASGNEKRARDQLREIARLLLLSQGETEAIRQALQALIDEGTYQQVLDRNNIGAYAVASAEVNQGAAQ